MTNKIVEMKKVVKITKKKKPIKMLARVKVTEKGHFYEGYEGIAVEQETDEAIYLVELEGLPKKYDDVAAWIHGDALSVIPSKKRKPRKPKEKK